MSRLTVCMLVVAACGPLAEGDEPGVCEAAPGAAIHTASFTDATTHMYAPDQIVADDEFVYFADGRAIHRVPRCGGPVEVVVADARPFNDGLALADGALYWIANEMAGSRIVTAPATGGAPRVLAEFTGYPHSIRVDAGTIVWDTSVSGLPDEALLLARDVAGEEVATRVLARHRHGWSFDLADGTVYAAGYLPGSDPAASERLLFTLPAAGGSPTVLVDGFGADRPTGVEVGDDDVFYVRARGGDPWTIEHVARTGGAPQVLDLAGAALPDALIHAGGQLYGVGEGGSVVRIRDGMAPVALISEDERTVPGPVFGDAGGLFASDSAVRCVEWFMDPSGEPPGMSCVRETIDVRVLSLGL